MKPTMAPVVSPEAGPSAVPATSTAAMVRTENSSPDGNRKAAMVPARMDEFRWRSMLPFVSAVVRRPMR